MPADPLRAMPGWYLLFVLVDDIPSEGRAVRIEAAGTPGVLDPGSGRLSMILLGNPSRGVSVLRWHLPIAGPVHLDVHDASGRIVWRWRMRHLPAGWSSLRWDGRDAAGRPLPAGIYWARLRAADRSGVVRLVRVRSPPTRVRWTGATATPGVS